MLEPTEIAFYEGLVRKTASLVAPYVQEEYDDIVAILRIKVWRALEAFDPARARQPIQGYVFMCVTNQKKDLLKRKRRQEVPLGDDYDVTVDSDQVYADVEDVAPVIPSTLTGFERRVVALLYVGYTERQAARELGVTRTILERSLDEVRTKMADWRPPTEAPAALIAA